MPEEYQHPSRTVERVVRLEIRLNVKATEDASDDALSLVACRMVREALLRNLVVVTAVEVEP